MSRAAALARLPKLNPSIVALGMYYDSQMAYAERIGVELILDTEAAAPHAKALNYVSVVGAGGDTVTVRDERTGETFTIKPKLVINAAGPWIDLANRAMGKQTRYIGGTKGSHIIVDHPELAKMLDGKGVYFENKDGRICIIIPLMDKVMIGATDIRADNPEVVCSDEEIDYFLSFTDVVLPGIKLDRSHIVFHFSGVRPLPASDASWTGQISRDHKIVVDEPDAGRAFPVYSLVGGKWTSFRAFGEETADKALAFLGRTRSIHTETMAIGGGKDYPRDTAAQRAWVEGMAKRTGIPVERAQTLFERYGTRAEQVATYIAQDVDTPLAHQPAYSRRELMWVATTERVVHLDDVLLRRSLLAMLGLLDGATLEDAGRAVGAALGWTEGETRAEIERAADILVREHGVPAARLSLPEAQL
jgi:glycerol-3-phosphate dehydrogenase